MLNCIVYYPKLGVTFLFLMIFSIGQAQSISHSGIDNITKIYNLSQEKYGVDQLLANGVFFEDIYRLATGHPYFRMDNFSKASIIYHNKSYKNIDVKFDIHAQRLIIQLRQNESPLLIVLTNEFISEFSIFNMQFIKTSFDKQKPVFYQAINDSGTVQCYYYWYKNRKETINDDDQFIYSFSGDKRRSFILKNEVLSRYSSNRSFRKLFPEDMGPQIKKYLKENKIKVKKASDQEIRDLVTHCQDLFDQRKM